MAGLGAKKEKKENPGMPWNPYAVRNRQEKRQAQTFPAIDHLRDIKTLENLILIGPLLPNKSTASTERE